MDCHIVEKDPQSAAWLLDRLGHTFALRGNRENITTAEVNPVSHSCLTYPLRGKRTEQINLMRIADAQKENEA